LNFIAELATIRYEDKSYIAQYTIEEDNDW
jgi:hypothetical protein